MSTATATKQASATNAPHNARNLPTIAGPRLPYHPAIEERFGIDRSSWTALVEAIFPGATTIESVILALSYCKARKLDPFKRVVHIVPIWSKQKGCMVDTVWPGIGELRTTAFRTGEYAGRGETTLGPTLTEKIGSHDMTFPEWAQVTVRRIIKGHVVDFVGPRVYWKETYATASRSDDSPNEMWRNRPFGQIDKCAEAAALRTAFPEEIGSDYIPEEVQHQKGASQTIDLESKPVAGLSDLTSKLQSQRQQQQQEHEPTADQALDSAVPPPEASNQPELTVPVDLESACMNAYENGDLAAFAKIDERWFGDGANWTEDPRTYKAGRDLFESYRDKLTASPSVKATRKAAQKSMVNNGPEYN